MSANSVWHWTILVELVVLLAVAGFVFVGTSGNADDQDPRRENEP